MGSSTRFRYIVVGANPANGERTSAGAVSNETLAALIDQLRATGHTAFRIVETLRAHDDPDAGLLDPALHDQTAA
jgi:hypothetical protein